MDGAITVASAAACRTQQHFFLSMRKDGVAVHRAACKRTPTLEEHVVVEIGAPLAQDDRHHTTARTKTTADGVRTVLLKTNFLPRKPSAFFTRRCSFPLSAWGVDQKSMPPLVSTPPITEEFQSS